MGRRVTKDYLSSFIRTSMRQEVQWQDVAEGQKAKVEIITPFKAKVEYQGEQGYVGFFVKILETTVDGYLTKGSYVAMVFPIRPWEKAMIGVRWKVKRSFTHRPNEDVSIAVEIEKVAKNKIRLLNFEKGYPTEEEVTIAAKFYEEGFYRQW